MIYMMYSPPSSTVYSPSYCYGLPVKIKKSKGLVSTHRTSLSSDIGISILHSRCECEGVWHAWRNGMIVSSMSKGVVCLYDCESPLFKWAYVWYCIPQP